MVVKVFDAYIKGEKQVTGTIDEIADYFDLSRNSISLWIKNGKNPKKANPEYKHAILNKEKTKELMEQKKKERRKHETKEERRLRRNIRAQMAIEAMQKNEF